MFTCLEIHDFAFLPSGVFNVGAELIRLLNWDFLELIIEFLEKGVGVVDLCVKFRRS